MSPEQIRIALPEGVPSGLFGVTRLTSTMSVCDDFLVEDRRLSCGFPIRKHLRVLRGSNTAWWARLIPHVASFASSDGRYVTGLLEAGQLTDGIYLLTVNHPAVLADLISPEPIIEKTAKALVRQMAHGLANLHQQVGPHGNLCSHSIRVNKLRLDEDLQVSIANTELGRLAVWSDFIVIPNGFAQTRPPEWKGDGSDQFTKEGDVYALGLIAAEMLLGSSTFRDARQSAANTKKPLAEEVETRLKAQGVSWSCRRTLRHLLAISPPARPRDGQAVVEMLSASVWDHWGWLVAGAAIVLIWLLSILRPAAPAAAVAQLQREFADESVQITRLESAVEQRRQEMETLEKELTATKVDLEVSRSTSNEGEQQLDRIRGLLEQRTPDLASTLKILDGIRAIVGTERPIDPADVAKQNWLELNLDQPMSKVLEELERVREEKKIPDEQYKLLRSWGGQLNSRMANWSAWISRRRPEEATFIEAWTKYRKAPWDESLRLSADQTSDALRMASRVWWEYASASKSESWDAFRSNVETETRTQANPVVEKVLNAWVAEFNRRRTWNLRIGNGKSAMGYGRWRLISVYLDGKFHLEDWREWGSDVAHDYESAEVSLSWRRGQAVEVLLEGERSYLTGTRPNLLDQPFGGPVALWSLHQAGVIEEKDFSLEIDVCDCPGPPRSIIQLFRKLAAGSAAANHPHK